MNNYTAQTDEQLVRMYEEGDFQAFDVLLARHQDKVFGYIRSMVPDTELANDIFQDTFVKIIMAIRNGHYTESGQFGSWVMRVARNQMLDRFRSLHNPNRVVVSHEQFDRDGDLLDLFNDPSLSEPNVESKMLVEQTHDDVRMMIDRLPDAQREVVIMRYFQDMSFKEIAQATGVSINTSLGRMRYALINLRRMAQHRNLYLSA
ncbi:MAG: sigma-70 family RNA polymerase sigma factor [Bacteroidaceae bacterium]|nr:sigma-70 family RNA polymerase sigma factor [Bacteroidaceae bacterium]MBR1788700.1 sigma-70 family RNA polymerase sigma factor [Bacteroidaceae bacterium]